MARLAQRDERMSTGALYGDLADRIEALTEQLTAARDDAKEAEAYAEELEQRLATCEKYRDAYAEMDRIGTQAVRDLEAKLAKAVEALEQIARPKVGPDFDWTEDETNKWRAVWYRKYQDIARATLAEIKGESHE